MVNSEFKLLTDYINNKLKDVTSYEEAIEELLKLSYFIDENKNYFKRYLLYELVEDNILLNNIIGIIANNLESFDNLEGLFDSETSILFIRAYAMQKGLIETNLDEFMEVRDLKTVL